ncbi:MAG TPA: DMT family transporter [Vitreimonas sp.]|uniref:DMT family transporter n=1 Tax=Vitreimonas sp. TaxID=3069702 RepID=UPI002D326E53|nr:DMT family transporter [Vitreimonas sp.]HYD88583.1 DMT family transporter [Vitreimonas sp.]
MFGRLPPALVLTLAIVAGSAMDATIKWLGQTNHILLVGFARYAIGTIFAYGIWVHAGRPVITREMWGAHAVRGFVIAGTAMTFFWALTVLPLAEAVTLSFIYPLIVPFVAWPMLGERVRPASLLAAGIGFVGVLTATQGAPPADESPLHTLGVAAVLVSACLFSIAMVLLRARAQTDGAPIVGLMTSFIPALIVAAPAIAVSPPPRAEDWPFFVLMGALAAGFMYLMAKAYARAEAQQLAPIHYTELLWASAIGFVVFHETPRIQIYIGAAFIIAACLFAAYHERRIAHAAAKETPT